MTKKYRLLKDLPYCKAGAEFKWCEKTGTRFHYTDGNNDTWEFPAHIIYNSKDWFEPIPEPSIGRWSDEDMVSFAQNLICQYKFGNTNLEQKLLIEAHLSSLKQSKSPQPPIGKFEWNIVWAMEFALNPSKYGLTILSAAKNFEKSRSTRPVEETKDWDWGLKQAIPLGELQQPSATPPKERVWVSWLHLLSNPTTQRFNYGFATNSVLPAKDLNQIKKAIEDVLNS